MGGFLTKKTKTEFGGCQFNEIQLTSIKHTRRLNAN
jgi:hypothetical protein